MPTATGPQEFSTGDRILFSGNGRTAQEKRAGLTNGNAGTITDIDMSGPKPRVAVALDTNGAEPRSVTFTVGDNAEAGEFNKLKLGYAGTIYKGQGATLDQTYVCHSAHWKSSAAYVALSRHKESVEIFASHETVKGMARDGETYTAAMARGVGRSENKRAATAYHIDAAHLARAEFQFAAEEAVSRPADIQIPPAFILADTGRQAAPVAGKATARAATGHKEASLGKSAAHSVRRTLSGLADGILRALMGESPTPRAPQTAEEYEQEILQRAKSAMQALGRVQEVAPINADHARMEEETAKKRREERSR